MPHSNGYFFKGNNFQPNAPISKENPQMHIFTAQRHVMDGGMYAVLEAFGTVSSHQSCKGAALVFVFRIVNKFYYGYGFFYIHINIFFHAFNFFSCLSSRPYVLCFSLGVFWFMCLVCLKCLKTAKFIFYCILMRWNLYATHRPTRQAVMSSVSSSLIQSLCRLFRHFEHVSF